MHKKTSTLKHLAGTCKGREGSASCGKSDMFSDERAMHARTKDRGKKQPAHGPTAHPSCMAPTVNHEPVMRHTALKTMPG